MEIRNPRPEETEQVKSLDSYCFDHEHRPDKTELFFRTAYKPEQTLGAFFDQKLAASLMVMPYRVRIRGSWYNCGGISSVATWPEYREAGLVRKLMFHALGRMRRNKQYISILGPFSYPYYQRMGWGLLYEKLYQEFSQESLKAFPSTGYTFQRLEAEDISAMREVYDRFTDGYEAVFDRSLSEWMIKLEWDALLGHHRYGAVGPDGRMEGTIHFEIRDRVFKIYELHFSSLSARQALLHFIHAHRSESDQVSWWNVPLDDTFSLEAETPAIKREIQTSMMGRITDVRGFFTGQSSDPAVNVRLSIGVTDSLAAWNQGIWTLEAGQGRIQIAPATETGNPDMNCDISVLSQMALGWMDAGQAVQAGLLQVQDSRALEAWKGLFPAGLTWMNEYF